MGKVKGKPKEDLAKKYAGTLSGKSANSLRKHVEKIRSEWERNF